MAETLSISNPVSLRSSNPCLLTPNLSARTRRSHLHFARPSRRSGGLCCACDATSVVVLEDDNYGRKQVVSLTPQLYQYVLANVREPQILRELREETAKRRGSQMQVSPDQAQLLAMLVQMLGAERCIEVGVYTGYSSLAIALALPNWGHIVACERDAECLEIAQKYYDLAHVSHKIKVGGVIVIDNVLWHGKVADLRVDDPRTAFIRKFNRKIYEDTRISMSMVPIGDGMTICRKILS